MCWIWRWCVGDHHCGSEYMLNLRLALLAGALVLAILPAANAQKMLSYFPSNPGPVPMWIKCTVTNSSTNLVVSGTGCTAATIAKAGALTQAVPLFPLLANGFVHNYTLKTSTAFAGTTTLLGGLGTTGTPNMFLVSAVTGYNMKAAVSATNLSTALPLLNGSDTASATNVVLQLTSTVDNLTLISAGILDCWILWSVRP